jgi:hypothetical protein
MVCDTLEEKGNIVHHRLKHWENTKTLVCDILEE